VDRDGNRVIKVYGEGKADVGCHDDARPPTEGVVSILTHKLCGKPDRMLVKRQRVAFLQQKGPRWQKVRFAKRQAHYDQTTDGVVFVLDSEGDEKKLKETKKDLEKGRDADDLSIPMAVGVAHPCIESWLLADATAIRRGLELDKSPNLPEDPESLPAPCLDRGNNPKAVLARAGGTTKKELSAKQKDKITTAINDFDPLRKRCPAGFAPFADEVQRHIRPICDTET
jgi:hypothetical protein